MLCLGVQILHGHSYPVAGAVGTHQVGGRVAEGAKPPKYYEGEYFSTLWEGRS